MADDLKQQMAAWLAAQRSYWQTLQHSDQAPSPESWTDFITLSQKTFGQALPPQYSQLVDILSAQSRNFNRFGADLLCRLHQPPGDTQPDTVITELQHYMQKQALELLLQQWQLPSQVAALFQTHSVRDELLLENPFIAGLKDLLESPATDAGSTLQRQLRESIGLLQQYQEALTAYIEHHTQINQDAGARMSQGVAAAEAPITTLRQLHDLWVASYEAAYSDRVFTPAYQQAHGNLSNALMQLLKFAQDVRDSQFETLGLATRRSLDTALQRQHQLRKQMKQTRREITELQQGLMALQQQHAPELLPDLRAEVAALRAEVALLRNQGKP